MNSTVHLLMMIQLLKDCENASISHREIIHDRVSKMYFIYRLLRKREERKKRKYWVRPIFREQMRHSQGASDNLITEMRFSDMDRFINYFRMSPTNFEKILNLVGPQITKQRTFRNPIPPRTRLEVTVRYLASGDSMASIAYAFRIGPNTVSKIISETCVEIWNVLKNRVFLQASEASWQKVAEDFKTQWNFPNCIGAIDGKHVVIQAPSNSGSSFYNYKGTHSINLLAISDANYCFTIVNIGAGGRQSDAGMFANSGLPDLFETNSLKLPPATRLENSNREFPYALVGDEAFPLTTYLMRPYPRSGNLNMTKKIFNYRLSRARRVVESAFGILAARWRIFRRPIIASSSTAKKIIQAATALHNFVIKCEEKLPPQDRQYCRSNDQENLVITGLRDNNIISRSRQVEAVRLRDAYAEYFEHVNPLPWQWEKVLNNDF